jgi:hypothetical protein
MDQKTIDFIITTNFSPYLKNLPLLKKTIKSLELISDLKTGSIYYRIIIAIDGLDPKFNSRRLKKNFQKYIKEINGLKNDKIIISDCELGGAGWGHLSGNICHAFDNFVKSEFVLLVQEDLPFIRNIPLKKIMDHMHSDSRLKYVRFNRRRNEIWGYDSELVPYIIEDLHYLKVNNWTDNNHLVKTKDYITDILPNLRGKRTFPENLIAPLNLKFPETFGTFLYGKLQEPNVIFHIGHLKHRIRVKMEFFGSTSSILSNLLFLIIISKDLITQILDQLFNLLNKSK